MNFKDILNNKSFQIGGVGIGCLAAGAALGYFYAMSKIEVVSVSELELLIEELEEDLSVPLPLEWDEEDEDPTIHLAHINEDFEHVLTLDQQIIEEDPEPEILNVFTRPDPWDYAIEEHRRENSNGTYVIHRDEFFADERGFTQLTFNYYALDDILVDESDKPIHNYSEVIGSLEWGHGSLDPNVFYCRNENLKEEFEVLHNNEFYSVEILGYDLESNYEEDDSKEKLLKFKDD